MVFLKFEKNPNKTAKFVNNNDYRVLLNIENDTHWVLGDFADGIYFKIRDPSSKSES